MRVDFNRFLIVTNINATIEFKRCFAFKLYLNICENPTTAI